MTGRPPHCCCDHRTCCDCGQLKHMPKHNSPTHIVRMEHKRQRRAMIYASPQKTGTLPQGVLQ